MSSEKKKSDVNIKAMTIRELKQIRNCQKYSGIVIKKMDKHLTFRWSCLEMLDKFVGRYKNSLLGKWMTSLNDQNCLHTDVSFYFIIFSPKINRSYQCTVTKVEKKYVLGKLFDIIPCMIKQVPEDVSIGSEVTFKFVRAEFKGKLAMLSGTFDGFVEAS
uniref:C2 domain-containing protein n=1 Tax=Strongyloides stercoralis TaxID=6248 RepID=A0A0K0EKV1_STRER